MRRFSLLLLFGVAALSLAPAKLAGQTAPAKPSAPQVTSIDAAMQQWVDSGAAAGIVTLVAHRGKVVHVGAVGVRDIESRKPMTAATLFSIASMTKPVTATALMILQDEGKLSVDEPVSKYLPAMADVKLDSGDPPARAITIRDALTHTSGITGNQIFSGSLAEAVEELATRPLAFQPGTKWQYGPGLSVVGRIIEVVSGMPYEEFLRQRIFEPLGMNQTTFVLDEQQRHRLAAVHAPGAEEGQLALVENHITGFRGESGANPSGGLASTARDLFRFYQMVLSGGEFRGQRILSPKAVEQMTSPQTGDLETGFTPGNRWGLGWCVVGQPQGVTEALSSGSFGHGGAFGTQGWVDPETETIYLLLLQRTKFGNSDGSQIRASFQQAANEALGI